jgi:BirA family biotin operon repressor/biotin-[acetyl-CoA-carboxylase] ligase
LLIGDHEIHVTEETGSTNDDALAFLAGGGRAPALFVADRQNHGRGSHGRTWDSPPGTDLYFSLAERLAIDLAALPPLTLSVGLAVADVIERQCHGPIRIKWPNDVLAADGRKCAGILLETHGPAIGRARTEQAVVIGVGINVNRRSWPGPLRATATSMVEQSLAGAQRAPDLDRAQLLAEVVARIATRTARFLEVGPAEASAELNGRLALRGREVAVADRVGTVVGVAPDGALELGTRAGVIRVYAGTLEPR